MVWIAVGVVAAAGLVAFGFFLRGTPATPGAAQPQSFSQPATVPAPGTRSATATTPTHSTPTVSPTQPSSSSGADSCLVGNWKGVNQIVPVMVGEPAAFTGPGPQQVVLKSDGTGSTTYGSGVTFGANIHGQAWTEVVTGGATFSYQTSNGVLLFSDAHGSGTQTLYVDGIKNVSAPLTAATSVRYVCSGNSLKLYSLTGSGSTELARTG